MKCIPFFLMLISLNCFAQKKRIYLIGDSTMANKVRPNENPEHGWGQVLGSFFNDDITIVNKAVNGRSTRSFINEKRWDTIYDLLNPGDYVFIQFGHNDEKIADSTRYTNPHTAYRYNLIQFVKDARSKGAIPVLFSSIVRRNFNEQGVLVPTHGDYPMETRLVAQEYNVPFIDLEYYSELLETAYGPEQSKKLHLHYKPGEIEYYPQGKEDNTHLSEEGATEIARIVVEELKSTILVLAKYIKD